MIRPQVILSPPVSPPIGSWQQELRRAVRDPAELCRLLKLPARFAEQAQAAARLFPLFAPRGYIARMRPGDPHDPLLRQVLPLDSEREVPPGFSIDPVADGAATLQPGLLHKYAGRVLLVTTGSCAVHCRYCFRRHYPYGDIPRGMDAWEPALAAIADDASASEVILSGGDPLTLVDAQLAALVDRLAAIPHVRRLRVHTRLPVMIPQRVTSALVDWLCGTRLRPIVVVHANHARELDEQVGQALARLAEEGAMLLNQSVLLAGVNDSVPALADLSERLLDYRVLPYYLHQLDRVAGAAHFEVAVERGRELIAALRDRLPGYAVPRYVCETPGAGSKLPLA